jgi:putative membrane protein
MNKPITFATAVAVGLALAACGSADRNESSATDANALTANEIGSAVDNTMPANETAMTMAPQSAPEFAAMAAASDLFEIESSKLAQSQGQSAQVKNFAAMLVKDHTASTNELKAIAARENMTLPPPTLRPDMQSKIDALKAAKGEQFDTLYMTQQVPAHEEALRLHQGYARSGDNAALKAFAAKTAPVVSRHLDEARTMAKQ